MFCRIVGHASIQTARVSGPSTIERSSFRGVRAGGAVDMGLEDRPGRPRFTRAMLFACVLFIGNSLTFANDLPGMLRALVDSSGAGPVEIHSVTAPNYSLGDHLETGAAAAQIQHHRPALVVLQQGP